jgi:eukaryotic-like serine/threonine-protein kinase
VRAQAHVGRFRLEEVLGAGGMALVYRAVDEHTGRPAAVKLLADNLAADEGFRRRFQREARLAARLSHPNVVRVIDAGEYEGRPWLALEYVEGDTLAEVLARRGRLPPGEVVALGRQLCAGLQHAHDAGLVHRDVKPANVLVRSDGSVTIVDFGIARAHEGTELTEHGSVLGTASYVAPELLTGGPVTAAADLYSLGAVLYEAAAGVAVRPAASLGELVARGAPPAPSLRDSADDVPPALEEAVARCLEVDPADRPASAREVARLLVAADRPTAALDTVVLPPSTPQRRHLSWSRARLFATALLVALVAVLAWSAWPSGSAEPPARSPATPREQAHDLTRWLKQHS